MVNKKFKNMGLWEKRIYALVIGAAIVLFWRGVWHLADELLFPNNPLLSSITSLVIALVILIATRHTIGGLLGLYYG